ncbi:penicillin-binding protein 2 [Blastococcus sp. CT_GayMR20]|uniref:peptidoglycan D,D-transpeptidase FtsI family protein n=1 Tax=Blastococcus sp. CT_GayMR20 TaxID=2559609 RepID=UPI0010745BC8|nr:penicillin-binding transpeptidase domain-containing protein [Blastococcus sp. CT_GayMR20]TFV92586.1 penicillin-binding protein 2 [Blastococcus sp. CT_GayMR20]TFV92627.1 penicillin-binding protein 2 [Blastococcus sp. CT_GayMR20]
MNAPLRRVAISILVLFTLLIINVNYIQVVRSDDLRDDTSNTRVLAAEYDRERGSIIVGGEPIALSVPTEGRLKYLRQYPQGGLYAAVTGYYSLIYNNSGIERVENDILSGKDPRLALRRLADMFTGRDPAGGDVVLTLDPAVQAAAMAGLEGVTGAVVALDPSTGAVLGLASTPTYDPGLLSSHDPDAIREYAAELDAADPDPRANQATREIYAPGSVFKVIVSAAALAEGYTPDTVIPAPTEFPLPNSSRVIPNFNGSSCSSTGEQSLLDALTISCNTAFAMLGIELGEDKVRAMAEAFGLDGERLQIPLTVEGSTVGDIEDDAALGQTSIGQRDVRVTTLQAAMIAAAVANDGSLMSPYLVDQLRAPDLSVIDETTPEELSRPVSTEIANQLTEMMQSVVERGSGRAARISGVEVAGKTGTAQTPDAPDHNWFVGFAPADDPTIAVAVFVKNGGGTGGDVSAPIAREVMAAHLAGQED